LADDVSASSVLALDIDGVLTDGTVAYGPDQRETKALAYHDFDAIRVAQQRGLRIVLVTAETGEWPAFVAQRTGADSLLTGAKDKTAAIHEIARTFDVEPSQICYVGDGDRDAPALSLVGRGFAPANATPLAKKAASHVLQARGGAGAVHEAVYLLLKEPPTPAPEAAAPSPSTTARIRAAMDEHMAVCQAALDAMTDDVARAGELITSALRQGGKVLILGNGGSAADAQHFAAELIGRFERERRALPSIALTTDTSILTALGNDYGLETIFARQVEGLGRAGDVLIAITTSGNSGNVLAAARCAGELGMATIGMTGESGGKLLPLVDLCLRVPSTRTARIQVVHALIIHALCELVDADTTA
jgi:D-sedoheptulose 7-phosphate isomerase